MYCVYMCVVFCMYVHKGHMYCVYMCVVFRMYVHKGHMYCVYMCVVFSGVADVWASHHQPGRLEEQHRVQF